MNLYLFPEAISKLDGYGIAVEYAYEKLKPEADDIIVWYTKQETIPFLKGNDYVIDKSKITFYKRLFNVLHCQPSTQLNSSDLRFLRKYNFERIYCDEILFFKALREIYPDKYIFVRLHNCFARIYNRYKMLNGISIDWRFRLILHLCSEAERYILNDKNSHKIFLTNEDRDYYTSTYGITSDSEVWSFSPNLKEVEEKRKKLFLSKKLIWFGGLDVHKRSSVLWFINDVFIPLKKNIPDLEFHMWGRGTSLLNRPKVDIYGHGFYEGDSFPDYESLYVNPDLLGGGIKLKILSYLTEGVPFISTQFGFEGYDSSLIDNKFCIVTDASKWREAITVALNNDIQK